MIRPAIIKDKTAVIDLMKAFFFAKGFDRSDNPYGFSVTPDEAYAEHIFIRHLTDPNSVCLVYERDGAGRGVLMATAYDHPFGRVRVADEFMWWVDPAYRGRGFRMIEAYKSWARDQGCKVVGMSHFEGDDEVGSLYSRLGGRPVDRKYLFQV